MKNFIILLILLIVSIPLIGQTTPTAFNPHYQLPSLINPNKIEMSHSISFSSAFSNGDAAYQSKYTNHIKFNLRKNLKLNVDLNLVNFGTANFNSFDIEGNNDNVTKILPDFSLEYKPTDNMTIKVEYNQSTPLNYYRRP